MHPSKIPLTAPRSPATVPSKMKSKMSEHDVKSKKKKLEASEPVPVIRKECLVHVKSSAPYPKSQVIIASSPKSPKEHQLRNKSSAPGVQNQRSEPNLKRAGSRYTPKYATSPRSPLNAPNDPELPQAESSWTLGDSDNQANVPRFMSAEQTRSIRPVRYKPPPKIGESKLPTIIGCTPTRSRFPELEPPKPETRSEKMIKAIRDPKGHMLKKYNGAMKQLSRAEMLKKMHKGLETVKMGGSKQIEARYIPPTVSEDREADRKAGQIQYKPLYRMGAVKRASRLFNTSGPQEPLPVAHVESMLEARRRQLSIGTTMSRRTTVYSRSAEGTAQSPKNEQGSEGQEGPATVNEEEDEDRTVRESIFLFREWLDFLQGTANPFAEDEGEEDFTSPEIPLTSPPQPSSSSLPLTQDTLRSFQNLFPTDDDRSNSSSSTSSDITITPANAHTFLAMSSSSESASHDPFVDSTEAKCTKAGDGNNASSLPTSSAGNSQTGLDPANPSPTISCLVLETTSEVTKTKHTDKHPAIMKQSTAKAGESSATEKTEPRTLKPLSYRSGNEPDTRTPHASHQAKDTKVRSSSRIPRGPANVQAQMPVSSEQKEARATPEPRSSIPLATRAHGAEPMSRASNTPVGSFSGSIRVVEKPRGPRPQIAAEGADPMEGSGGKLEMPERMSSSSGSTFTSSWVAGEESDLQKPPTVFTGEYRRRAFSRSGSRLESGPKLKIASSAENVLMGTATKGNDDADTPRSHPALEHSDSLEHLQENTEDADDTTPRAQPTSTSSHKPSDEQTPVARNFCRPHNLGASLRSNPVTPTQMPLGEFSDDIDTGHRSVSRSAHRSSSLQAVADFPLHPKTTSVKDLTGSKRDIGQEELAAKASSGQTQAGVRRFGNIRNIFKSTKSGSEKSKEVPETVKARGRRHAKISPAQISPPMPLADEETASLARVTTATRTRAEPPRDGRIRRANLAATSTGSPQRRDVRRRSQVLMPPRVSTPSRVIGSAHDVAMVIRDEADAATKVADVGSCIEGLIAKARDAAAPGTREDYLRLALRLQKQLEEYKGAERAAVEAEACAAKKRSARADAETALFAVLSGVLSHLGEDQMGQ